MTREEAKELLPIIQAFAEGKTIQVRINNDSSWTDLLDDKLEISNLYEYRIKPEPKYRPLKSQEECWNEMLKHHPFGWVKNIETGDLCNISNIYESAGCAKVFLDTCAYTFSSLLNEFTFIDGTPFGIKEE